MKSLLIEHVQNGWIVRPFTPNRCDWARGDEDQIFVFATVEGLTQFLNIYLKDPEPAPGFPPHPCSVSPQPANEPPEPWPNPPREFP